MATPSAKRPPAQPKRQLEVVDPRWLLKALGIAIAAAAVCAYLAVCLLVYQGGWQTLLRPSTTIDRKPSIAFQPIRFDAAETGQPRLTGWWIPSATNNPPTILFLHDGSGSLSNAVPTIELLHRAGVNIFAIDYRGFGQSSPPHPTEARMAEDAANALEYLVDTRHIPVASIIPYGQGLGAVLAAALASSHPELPALILENPDPEAFERTIRDTRTRLLPMRLLLQERFDLAAALAGSKQPELLLADSPEASAAERIATNQAFFHSIPDPKFIVTFNGSNAQDAYLDSLRRFLDEYAAAPIPLLKGAP